MSKRAALEKKGSSPVYAPMIARFKGGGRRNSNADDGLSDGIKVGESRSYYTLVMHTFTRCYEGFCTPTRGKEKKGQ
jgi:hypothetical protein